MAAPPLSVPGIPMSLPIGIDGGVRLDRPMEGPPVNRMEAPAAPRVARPARPDGVNGPTPFESLLQNAIGESNQKLQVAEQAASDFASGKSDDIHGTMIAVSQADIQLRLVGSMRNRIIEAFNEIWRMQV